MTELEELKYIKNLLKTISDAEMSSDLMFSVDENNKISFGINCSDIFYMATADCESLTPENLYILKKCIEMERKIYGFEGIYAGIMFCSIVRNMNPHKIYIDRNPEYNNLTIDKIRNFKIDDILSS